MDPQESAGEDPALQKAPDLSLDETRRRASVVGGPGEKSLELLGVDLVKDSLVCPARSIDGRGDASGSNGGVEGPRCGAVAMLAR